jgi:5-formyltetrahydrofolate cyclo-ligase
MTKKELRLLVRQQMRQFTQQQMSELSLPIIARIRAHLLHAQTIVAYYSLADEVDTHQLVDTLLSEGKEVYLPRVISDTEMVLCRYTGPESLQSGAYGIMEPVGDPISERTTIDVILVPGVAFDAEGHRLGRGKGYYDRFLGALPMPRPKLIGICFDFQKVGYVPIDLCDVAVDVVI